MTIRQLFYVLAALGLCSLETLATASGQTLNFPFQLPAMRADAPSAPVRCSASPAPLVDMSGLFSFYAPGSTQSVVDRERMAAYVRRLGVTDRVKDALLYLQKRVDGAPSARPGVALCMRQILVQWARADALLGNVEDNDRVGRRQAALVATWTVIAMANAFQLADDGRFEQADRVVVLDWFGRLAASIRESFPQFGGPPASVEWLRMTANHSHWAGIALGMVGVARGEAAPVDAAVAELRRGLSGATAEGALPVELRRGGRGLHYQSFALSAIALLVRLADANGRRLDAADERRLAAVTRFTLDAWEQPERLKPYAQGAQEKKPDMLVFAELLRDHFAGRDPELATRLDCAAAPHRPFSWAFIGLDVSARTPLPAALACKT